MPVTITDSATLGRTDHWQTTIQERRQRIADLARCRGCGTDQKTCEAGRKDRRGPEGLCCWGGIPGHGHVEDPRLIDELFQEIQAGKVRTVEEAFPAAPLGPDRVTVHWLLWQAEWWYPNCRPAIRIADMDETHRFNTANWLQRRATAYVDAEYYRMVFSPLQPGGDAAQDAFGAELAMMQERPISWLEGTPLLRALRAGLPTGKKKLEKLGERARHWHTCPMRLKPKNRTDGATCTCVREGFKVVGATNDPNGPTPRPRYGLEPAPEWTLG